jgi:hypothetical protein
MDIRLTADQAALFDTMTRIASDLGPGAVGDLDDAPRRVRLDEAVAATGVRALRDRSDDDAALASGVESALVAQALGRAPADTAYLGPSLAGDLRRRAGLDGDGVARTVALTPDLSHPIVAAGGQLGAAAVAVDAAGAERAVVLVEVDGDRHLGEVELAGASAGADITRCQVDLAADAPVVIVGDRPITDDALTGWAAFGLAVAAADAVGAMGGAVRLGVDYAADRRQYGAPVGSFQAVQHLLAEAHTLADGALSISRHASWAADAMEPADAHRAAARAAVYVGRAQRTVAETVIQVHGGIGNTWECMAHVFLRRMFLDDAILGTAEALLGDLAASREGAFVALP